MRSNIPIGARLSIIGRTFKKELDTILLEEDITSVQFSVLIAILDYMENGETEINQRMLEEAVHVTHPTMTELVKKLCKKDFINSSIDSRDKRRKNISLTEKSLNLLSRLDRAQDEVWLKLSVGLSESETALFLGISNKILDNLSSAKK